MAGGLFTYSFPVHLYRTGKFFETSLTLHERGCVDFGKLNMNQVGLFSSSSSVFTLRGGQTGRIFQSCCKRWEIVCGRVAFGWSETYLLKATNENDYADLNCD